MFVKFYQPSLDFNCIWQCVTILSSDPIHQCIWQYFTKYLIHIFWDTLVRVSALVSRSFWRIFKACSSTFLEPILCCIWQFTILYNTLQNFTKFYNTLEYFREGEGGQRLARAFVMVMECPGFPIRNQEWGLFNAAALINAGFLVFTLRGASFCLFPFPEWAIALY